MTRNWVPTSLELNPIRAAAYPKDPRASAGRERQHAKQVQLGTVQLNVRSYGTSPAVGQRLVDQVLAWDAAGRPSSEDLRVRAYPHAADYVPSANEFVVHKKRTQLVLYWS